MSFEQAFGIGFGVVFGVGLAVWVLAVFFGVDLTSFCRDKD